MKRAIVDLNLEPRVYTVDNFLSPAECKHLIDIAQNQEMKRAFVSGPNEGVVSQGRTNDLCWVKHFHTSGTGNIATKVAALVGLPLTHAENFQLIRYDVGAEYRPHFDAFDPRTEAGARTMKDGGQRVITVLGYLNTVQKGGGTSFPKLKIRVPAEEGKLLVFHNCKAGTEVRHPKSLHAGLPVEAGEKWAFNLWFRAERIC